VAKIRVEEVELERLKSEMDVAPVAGVNEATGWEQSERAELALQAMLVESRSESRQAKLVQEIVDASTTASGADRDWRVKYLNRKGSKSCRSMTVRWGWCDGGRCRGAGPDVSAVLRTCDENG